jgi:hypothetical protein
VLLEDVSFQFRDKNGVKIDSRFRIGFIDLFDVEQFCLQEVVVESPERSADARLNYTISHLVHSNMIILEFQMLTRREKLALSSHDSSFFPVTSTMSRVGEPMPN